jgi:hypothetical protein
MTRLSPDINGNDHRSANFRMNCFNFDDFTKYFNFAYLNISNLLNAHEGKWNIFIFKDFEVFNRVTIFFSQIM